MKHRNYYEILEIPTNATAEEIKRAYYLLCKKYHPDINPETGNLFKNINEAYETLIDPIKRKNYDRNTKAKTNTAKNFTSDYYSKAEYYQNLDKEPIIKLLLRFFNYRFENVFKSIWNRYWIVLVVTSLFCFSLTIVSIINKITLLFDKPIIKDIPHKTQIEPIALFLNLAGEAKITRSMIWTVFITTTTVFKTFAIIFKAIHWIFAHIIKPMLIPMAIILAALFLSNNQNQRNNYFRRY